MCTPLLFSEEYSIDQKMKEESPEEVVNTLVSEENRVFANTTISHNYRMKNKIHESNKCNWVRY